MRPRDSEQELNGATVSRSSASPTIAYLPTGGGGVQGRRSGVPHTARRRSAGRRPSSRAGYGLCPCRPSPEDDAARGRAPRSASATAYSKRCKSTPCIGCPEPFDVIDDHVVANRVRVRDVVKPTLDRREVRAAPKQVRMMDPYAQFA